MRPSDRQQQRSSEFDDRIERTQGAPTPPGAELPAAIAELPVAKMVGSFMDMARNAQAAWTDAAMTGWRNSLAGFQLDQKSPRAADLHNSRPSRPTARPLDEGRAADSEPATEPPADVLPQRGMQAIGEMSTLMQKRARAYAEWPVRLAACKHPQDVLAAQMTFWQTAARDFSDSGQRIVSTMTRDAAARPGKVPSVQQVLGNKGVTAEPDLANRRDQGRDQGEQGGVEGGHRGPDGSPRRVA